MNPITEQIKELLLVNAKAIVDREEDVSVQIMQGEQTTVFEVRVHRTDLGKIIGKHGKMAQSLRTILQAISTKHKIRAIMEIME